ncbi:MAG TPA: acetyl-CoA carboxylase biotin carboxyl carrier protein [Oscillatoriaceae cyanobacterium]
MTLGLDDIKALLAAVDASSVAELSLESGEFKLVLKKASSQAPVVVQAAPAIAPAAPAPAPVATPVGMPEQVPTLPSKAITINAPMVGSFYRSPSPDAPPFVQVGDVVKPGQTVCIIEAMKLMNELEAEVSGRVARILVENGQPVEYGQPLIELEPA